MRAVSNGKASKSFALKQNSGPSARLCVTSWPGKRFLGMPRSGSVSSSDESSVTKEPKEGAHLRIFRWRNPHGPWSMGHGPMGHATSSRCRTKAETFPRRCLSPHPLRRAAPPQGFRGVKRFLVPPGTQASRPREPQAPDKGGSLRTVYSSTSLSAFNALLVAYACAKHSRGYGGAELTQLIEQRQRTSSDVVRCMQK